MTPVPQAYQDGFAMFCGLNFKVTPDVLIPRYETQQMVDEVVSYTRIGPGVRIVDIGTGSGCIAVTLAQRLPKAVITATDISSKALIIAKENALAHGVSYRINFLRSDLLNEFKGEAEVIVANLPYIPSTRIPTLEKSVIDYEPLIALDGGSDGFDLYRKLFSQMIEKDIGFKYFICEIDEDQQSVALEAAGKFFPKSKINVIQDFFKFDRFLVINQLV